MQKLLAPVIFAAAFLAVGLSGCVGSTGGDAEDREDPVSIVGTQPYDGPTTAEGLQQLCGDLGESDEQDCYVEHLKGLLAGRGAEAAFSTLENLTDLVPDVRGRAHPLAHELGRYAFEAYGSIQLTLEECSYKVFAGCFHGSLEAYFSSLDRVTRTSLEGLCPSDNRFREYTCLHGVGHGLMLNTEYDMDGSLHLCDGLPDWFARGSCYGGIFMQNMVGYFESLDPSAHQHGHGSEEIEYKVDSEDPYYPCNDVGNDYQNSCWLMQTSLILHFNQGDFEATALICEDEPTGHKDLCFRSYGRDAAPYTDRDLDTAIVYCSYPSQDGWKGLCMAGYVAESILNYVDPGLGISICSQVPEVMKHECYKETGQQARYMLASDPQVDELCAGAEAAFVASCRSGGQL